MKLRDCVLMGLFSGLDTVEECVANYELHYLQCIPHDEVRKDIIELNKDLADYEKGTLVLDWDELKKLNELAWEEMIASDAYNTHAPMEELEF